MTGEEMERAIEFILQSQANAEARMAAFDARQDRTDQQIAEMSQQIKAYADTQSQFIEIVTRSLQGLAATQERTHREMAELNARTDQRIAESNARIAETNARVAETDVRLAERIAKTNERIEQLASESRTRGAEIDARLDRLAETTARTDARLDRLAALVERNISGGNGNA